MGFIAILYNGVPIPIKNGITAQAQMTHTANRFMISLYNLLDGPYNHRKFEANCQVIVETQSYVLFISQKLIHELAGQLRGVFISRAANSIRQGVSS